MMRPSTHSRRLTCGLRTGAVCAAVMTAGVWCAGCGARTPPPATVPGAAEPMPPEAAMTPEEAAEALKTQRHVKQKR